MGGGRRGEWGGGVHSSVCAHVSCECMGVRACMRQHAPGQNVLCGRMPCTHTCMHACECDASGTVSDGASAMPLPVLCVRTPLVLSHCRYTTPLHQHLHPFYCFHVFLQSPLSIINF